MITFIVQGEFSYDPEMNPNPPLPGCRLETRTLTETVYCSCRTLEEAKKLYVKSALRQIAKQMIEAGESLDLDHPRGTSEVGVGHIMA